MTSESDNEFIVTQIVRGSHVDGPGLRSVFFLKGCILRCGWCHNPETQTASPEITYDARKCLRCGECAVACAKGAINPDGTYVVQLDKCDHCMDCADACPTGALKPSGRRMTVDEVFVEILKDKVFYDHSGGGVTFSGGEPLLHSVPLRYVLEKCRTDGVSTCVDTSLAVAWEDIDRVREYVDLFLVDVKHSEQQEVRAKEVLENLRRLAGHARVWVRIPVIPDWNASDEEMGRIAAALDSLGSGIEKVCLLPFHKTAEMRYKYLNREWEHYPNMDDVPEADLASYEKLFASRGHTVQVGG